MSCEQKDIGADLDHLPERSCADCGRRMGKHGSVTLIEDTALLVQLTIQLAACALKSKMNLPINSTKKFHGRSPSEGGPTLQARRSDEGTNDGSRLLPSGKITSYPFRAEPAVILAAKPCINAEVTGHTRGCPADLSPKDCEALPMATAGCYYYGRTLPTRSVR